jgi:hypothetical protein
MKFASIRRRTPHVNPVGLPSRGAERGLDIERGRFRVCRQHLCDNGGDGAGIAGAVGKQHGVTVLEGKRHDARIAPRAFTAEQLRPPVGRSGGRMLACHKRGTQPADEATS